MKNKKLLKKKVGCKWIIKQSYGTKRYLFIIILSRLIFTVMNLAFAMLLSAFMNYATGVRTYSLYEMAIVALVLCLIEGLIFVTESICKKIIYSNMEKKMRIDTLSKIQNSSMLQIQLFNSSELMMRLTKDIELVANSLPSVIINVFGGLVMAFASLCYMFYLSWRLSIIIIITIPALILVIGIFTPILKKYSQKDKENEDVNRKRMDDVINTLALTRIFSANSLLLDKVKKSYSNKYKSSIKLGYIDGIFSFFNNLMGSVMFLVILGVGSYFTAKGEFTVGSMIAVINLLNYVVWPFSNISTSISEFNQAIVSASRIDELQQLIQSDEDKKHIIYKKCDSDETCVNMEDISFGYRDKDILLKNVNLSLHKNEIIGLIGRNGCGKSTLIKILLGIYSPIGGSVTIFDKDIDIRKQNHNIITYVPSNNYVFSGNIRENICMSADVDELKMIECATRTNAHEFIMELQNKYDEQIGENGNTLSSGQAQRIALARAFYQDSLILAFDEPTSNLDYQSIIQFHEELKKIKKYSICVIATHERSTIEICDKVYVVENGSVREVIKEQAREFIDEMDVNKK